MKFAILLKIFTVAAFLVSCKFSEGFLDSPLSGQSAVPNTTQDTVTQPEGTFVSEITVLVTELGPYETYIDPTIGIAFDYPSDWDILALPDLPGSSITISSWNQSEAGAGGIPAGGQKLDIVPLSDSIYADALSMLRKQYEGRAIDEFEVLLPSGVKGVLFFLPNRKSEPQTRLLLASVRGAPIIISGLGTPLTYFEAIAYTLRPAQ